MRLCSPEYIVPRLWWCFCDSPTVVKNSKSRKKHLRAHQDTCSIPLPPGDTQKVNTRNRHQRRRKGRKVRSREAKPEFKIGMRRKVTRGKLLRRTKHTHPALLMASLCGRPRWPCGCRHTSFSNLLPSEQTTISHSCSRPALLAPRTPSSTTKPFLLKFKKKNPPFFSHSPPQLLLLLLLIPVRKQPKTKTRRQDYSQTDPLKTMKNKSCALARGRGCGWECAFIEWKPKNGSKQTSTTPIAGWYSSNFKIKIQT